MHRSRYYRYPTMYHPGSTRFPLNHTRSTYKTTSTTPFSPSQMKAKSRVDRSKYVWTANQQPSQSTQPQTSVQQTSAKPIRTTPVVQIKKIPSSHDLTVLTVTALDSPVAVAKDIALHLREKKDYLISTVVNVVGVKKAIKLYYDTRVKEHNGGMLVQNGNRRRTPGGVYLSLLRESSYITQAEAEKVQYEIRKYESQAKLYYPAY